MICSLLYERVSVRIFLKCKTLLLKNSRDIVLWFKLVRITAATADYISSASWMHSDRLAPTQCPIQIMPCASSLWVKWSGHEADNSPLSSSKNANTWSYTCTPRYPFILLCLIRHRDNFILNFTYCKRWFCKWLQIPIILLNIFLQVFFSGCERQSLRMVDICQYITWKYSMWSVCAVECKLELWTTSLLFPCDIKVMLHDVVQSLENCDQHLYLLVSTVNVKSSGTKCSDFK